MAERRIGGGVPELSTMSVQEIQCRLRVLEEAIAVTCQTCDRRVTRLSEAVVHDRGRRHDEMVDAFARRSARFNRGAVHDEASWCGVCGASGGSS